jgi:hypothetical protein
MLCFSFFSGHHGTLCMGSLEYHIRYIGYFFYQYATLLSDYVGYFADDTVNIGGFNMN